MYSPSCPATVGTLKWLYSHASLKDKLRWDRKRPKLLYDRHKWWWEINGRKSRSVFVRRSIKKWEEIHGV